MFRIIKPPAQLRKYIDFFWLGDDEDLQGNPNSHHSIATSRMELLFFCKGTYASKDKDGNIQNVFKAGFYGHKTGFEHYFAMAKRTTIFGIRFSPIASLSLFGIPASELTNQKTEIENILGWDSKELTEDIFGASTFQEQTKIAIDFFIRKIKPLHVKYRMVEYALNKMQEVGNPSLTELIKTSCLSPRQFERHFKELTGFSARTYLKLHRFEKLVETGTMSQIISDNSLNEIAFQAGYYDQAHFNRHFREFTGINPGTYFKKILLTAGN